MSFTVVVADKGKVVIGTHTGKTALLDADVYADMEITPDKSLGVMVVPAGTREWHQMIPPEPRIFTLEEYTSPQAKFKVERDVIKLDEWADWDAGLDVFLGYSPRTKTWLYWLAEARFNR